MLKIDIIDCDIENITKTYLFALFIANKSITKSNISVFEDLFIGQLGLNKDNSCFEELFILWWGGLKTKI